MGTASSTDVGLSCSVIEAGKWADIVVVSGNPLKTSRNCGK